MYVCMSVCLYVCMLHMYTYIWIDYICKYIYIHIYVCVYYCSLLFGHRSAISSLEILPPNISNADSGWSKGTSVEKLCREHVSHLEIWNNWWDGSGLMSLHTFLVLSSLLTSLWLPYVVITVVAINPVRKTMVILKNQLIIIVNPSGPYLRLKQARFPSLPSSYSCSTSHATVIRTWAFESIQLAPTSLDPSPALLHRWQELRLWHLARKHKSTLQSTDLPL